MNGEPSVRGWVRGEPGVASYTVRELVAALLERIAEVPEVADAPVTVLLGGSAFVPTTVFTTGNTDPEIGGHLRASMLIHAAKIPPVAAMPS